MTSQEDSQPPATASDQEVADPRPQDDLEREVAAWASAHRNEFPGRREFNLALCDKLAARGIAPLGGVLRRLGGRGTATSQAEDVRQWYAALQSRLGTLEAQIPLGARRMANNLVEQLWAAARNEVDARLVAPMRQELARAQDELVERKERVRELEALLAEERNRSGRLAHDLHEAGQKLEALTQRRQHEVEVARQELEDERRRHAAERDDLRAKMALAASEHAAALQQLQARHDAAQEAATAERRRMLVQVDEHSQTARDWRQRHDEVAKRRDQVQERLEASMAAEARAQADAAAARRAGEELSGHVRQLEGALAQEKQAHHAAGSELAVARERIRALQEQLQALADRERTDKAKPPHPRGAAPRGGA